CKFVQPRNRRHAGPTPCRPHLDDHNFPRERIEARIRHRLVWQDLIEMNLRRPIAKLNGTVQNCSRCEAGNRDERNPKGHSPTPYAIIVLLPSNRGSSRGDCAVVSEWPSGSSDAGCGRNTLVLYWR